MEAIENNTQEILWLSSELHREVKTLTNTQYPHIHTFLAKNLMKEIEKQLTDVRQALTHEHKEKAS